MNRADQKSRLMAGVTVALAAILVGFYLAVFIITWVPMVGNQTNDIDVDAVGADFSLYWSASYLTLAGEPAAVYEPKRLLQVEEAVTGKPGFFPWRYPPTFLMLVAPLSLAPYYMALSIWLVLTLAPFLWVIHCFSSSPRTIFLTLAFPGTFLNFFYGQNGFLSATLLGGGLFLLERSPFIAGLLIGLLSYKPNLVVLPIVALAAGKHWKSLGGAMTAALGTALLSLLILGPGPWTAFWKDVLRAGQAMATQVTPILYKMPSIYAALRQAGLGPGAAWLFQGITMAAVTGAVFWVWFRKSSASARSAVLIGAILLFTPHIFYYDFVLLAIPLAIFWQEPRNQGSKPAEQAILILIWIMPLVTLGLAVLYKQWLLGAIVPMGIFLFGIRRFLEEKQITAATEAGYGTKL